MAIKFQKVLKVLGILSLLLGEPANLQEKKLLWDLLFHLTFPHFLSSEDVKGFRGCICETFSATSAEHGSAPHQPRALVPSTGW